MAAVLAADVDPESFVRGLVISLSLSDQPSRWPSPTREELLARYRRVHTSGTDLVGVNVAVADRAAQSRPVVNCKGRLRVDWREQDWTARGPRAGVEDTNAAAARQATQVGQVDDGALRARRDCR